MKIRTLFIAAGVAAVLVGAFAIGAMEMATAAEDHAEARQRRAQQMARDVAGLVGVTYLFQRERDELSVSEWKRWHANIARGLDAAGPQGESQPELELLKDAADRLPALFERALQTSAAPATDFERRRRDQAFELLLGDTQAMADAAFRWSRNAGDARGDAEDVHERVTMTAIASFSLLLAGLAALGVRRVLRPLARLTEAAEALERGEQVPLFGSTAKDELGTLKRRFDAMTIALQRRTDELREAEQRMRDIADNLPVMISYIDKDQRLLFLNETFSKWTGLDHRATIGKTVAEAIPAPLYEQRREHLARALGGERVEFHIDSSAAGVARSLHNLYLPDFAADGSVRGLYALSTDVTERRLLERQLAELARTDTLTGLPNRYSFNEQLAAAIKRAQRAQTLTALLFLDVDKFKLINDSHGHGVGDEVLREFARRLLSLVRGTDFVGRLAGDEFVVVLEGLRAPVEAEVVAGKIIEAINQPFEVSAGTLSICTSIGVAIHPGDQLNSEELLGRADQALYQAKDAGRNQYRLHAR